MELVIKTKVTEKTGTLADRLVDLGQRLNGDEIRVVLLPAERGMLHFGKVRQEAASLLAGGDRPFRQPQAMIHYGTISECVKWVNRTDERPESKCYLSTWEFPQLDWQLSLIKVTCSGVICSTIEQAAMWKEKGVAAFLPEQHEAIREALLKKEAKRATRVFDSGQSLCAVIPIDGSSFVEMERSGEGVQKEERLFGVGFDFVVWGVCSDEVWNMSKARNHGLKQAELLDAVLVAFVDGDIEVPDEYGFLLKELLSGGAPKVVVPSVREIGQPRSAPVQGRIEQNVAEKGDLLKAFEGITAKSNSRPGTGNLAAPMFVFRMIGNFDEDFVGGGSEDIDWLYRFRDLFGEMDTVGEVTVEHRWHEPRPDRITWEKVNAELLKKKRGL